MGELIKERFKYMYLKVINIENYIIFSAFTEWKLVNKKTGKMDQ